MNHEATFGAAELQVVGALVDDAAALFDELVGNESCQFLLVDGSDFDLDAWSCLSLCGIGVGAVSAVVSTFVANEVAFAFLANGEVISRCPAFAPRP